MATDFEIPHSRLKSLAPFHSHQLENGGKAKTREKTEFLFGSQPAFSKSLFLLGDDQPIKK